MRTRVTLWFKGALWALAGISSLICWGSFGGIVWIALGIPLLLYGIVLIVQDRMVRGKVELSEKDIQQWGERLSAGTPEMLELLEAGETPLFVARTLEEGRGIPQEITLRYIIALGNHGK